MAVRRPLVLRDGLCVELPSGDHPSLGVLPTDVRQVLGSSLAGALLWRALPIFDAFEGGTQRTNLRLFLQTALSTRPSTYVGQATFWPTTNGQSTGTPLFSSIAFAAAVPFSGNVDSYESALCTGRLIAGDLKSVTFSVVKGQAMLLGGFSLVAAPANTICYGLVIGQPVAS